MTTQPTRQQRVPGEKRSLVTRLGDIVRHGECTWMDSKKGKLLTTCNIISTGSTSLWKVTTYLCNNPQQASNVIHRDLGNGLLLLAPQLLIIKICMVTFFSQATSVEGCDLEIPFSGTTWRYVVSLEFPVVSVAAPNHAETWWIAMLHESAPHIAKYICWFTTTII